MKKSLILCCVGCFVLGFVFGRMTIRDNEIVRYVAGETVCDTITEFVPDTVYLEGKIKYKYEYRIDTVYRDVPVVDREKTIVATVEDWNRVREYKKVLFDDGNGRLSVDLAVRYNELQRLSYAFTPMQRETVVRKERVFVPFISVALGSNDKIFGGVGFFFYLVGLRVVWTNVGGNLGVMYKF